MLCPAFLHPAVSPARRQSRQRRTVAAPVVASGFLPPLVPNPWPAGRRPDTLVELLHVHGKKWSLVKPAEGENDSHGNHLTTGGGPRLRRHVACGDKGHALLDGLQQELYVPGEQVRTSAWGCFVSKQRAQRVGLTVASARLRCLS